MLKPDQAYTFIKAVVKASEMNIDVSNNCMETSKRYVFAIKPKSVKSFKGYIGPSLFVMKDNLDVGECTIPMLPKEELKNMISHKELKEVDIPE